MMIIQLNGRLDSRKAFKDKDPLKMTSRQTSKFSKDDVMVGYRAFTNIGRLISSKCWRLIRTKFKSTWGLMLGI